MSRDDTDHNEPDITELDDRDRVLAEAPASPVGGMWFTPDETAPGGVRPLTEAELREVTAWVLATQGGAVDLETVDRQIRESSQQFIDADHEQPDVRGYSRAGEHLTDRHDGDATDGVDEVDERGGSAVTGAAFPPPPGGAGSEDEVLTGLARELDLVRRRVETLSSSVDGVPGRVEDLAQVVARLSDTLATVAARHRAPVAPSWLLAPADPDEIGVLLDGLAGWLEVVFLRYPDAASALPECWMWHPAVVEELVWLMHAWSAAYQGAAASVAAAGDWHDRQRPGVVARIRKAAGSCSIEAHRTRPGWPADPTGPVPTPCVEHTALIVSWWAGHRDQPAPEPPATRRDECGTRPIGGALG